ncbi:MAG: acetylglutamate kinase [Acidimicrobiales bacterium]
MSRVVVKIGGHALDRLDAGSAVLADLATDVAELRGRGDDVACVHGGGPQISALLAERGLVDRFHDGLRITDDATMEVVAIALSWVNLAVVAAFGRAGVLGAGVSGADGATLTATSLGAPWGRVGATPDVNPALIELLWAGGVTPVVSPVALDADGGLLNVNADTVAGALAGTLGAARVVLLSDVERVRADADDPASALSRLESGEARALVASGAARDGMRPKLRAALDAIAGGASRVTLAGGTGRHALREALAGSIPTTEVVA